MQNKFAVKQITWKKLKMLEQLLLTVENTFDSSNC